MALCTKCGRQVSGLLARLGIRRLCAQWTAQRRARRSACSAVGSRVMHGVSWGADPVSLAWCALCYLRQANKGTLIFEDRTELAGTREEVLPREKCLAQAQSRARSAIAKLLEEDEPQDEGRRFLEGIIERARQVEATPDKVVQVQTWQPGRVFEFAFDAEARVLIEARRSQEVQRELLAMALSMPGHEWLPEVAALQQAERDAQEGCDSPA